MSKINYKIDAENESFYIMENPKSSGLVERRYPRMYQCVPLSNDGFKIISLENQLQTYIGKIDDHTINSVEFTDVFEFCKELAQVIYTGGTPAATPIDYTDLLQEIIDEIKNDDSYQLFEDVDGNVLFGKIDDTGVMKYYRPDGSEYTGAVKPYSRELKQTITDYCADSVPFSLIQLRDSDTKEVVASIWRNDIDLTESTTAPANVTKGVCVAPVDPDTTIVSYQMQDCEGNDIGTPVDVVQNVVLNKVTTSICNVSDIVDPLLEKLDEVITTINDTSTAEQAILTSIDTKLDLLTDIKSELVTANTTLTNIKTDTASINQSLLDALDKLDIQIQLLEDLKLLLQDGQTALSEIKDLLINIDVNIELIATDISAIKSDVSEIKTDVKSILTKLDTVITSLSNIETLIEESNTLLQSLLDEFDQELVYTDVTKTNNGTSNFYTREKIIFDSETGGEITRVREFSTDGVEFTQTVPSGTLEIGWITAEATEEIDFILGVDKVFCGTNTTDGTKVDYLIRQDYTFNNVTSEKIALPLEYSVDGLTWTTTAPTDVTFTLGSCPIEAVEPYCIENVTYNIVGNKGIVFEANKIFEYQGVVYDGKAKLTEVNSTLEGESSWEFGNGDVVLQMPLKNEVVIVNTGGTTSDTRISVMQICGYVPLQPEVIDETLLRLNTSAGNAGRTAIVSNFNKVVNPAGVETATSYVVKRYLKGADVTTAVTLSTLNVGTPNSLFVDNGNGTYTFTDSTAVAEIDYVYFYEASNAISSGKSNELEARLFSTSFKPKFKTTTPNETVTLPMTTNAPVVIDWGDGIVETKSAPFTHTYATAGTYDIEVKITASREVNNFRFNNAGDRLKLIDIKNWGWVKLASGANFFGCSELTKITAEDTPQGLTNMTSFLNGCSKLNQIDNFNWDTSQVTSMIATFAHCTLFNLPVAQLDTSNVTNMGAMFQFAPAFNQPVPFDTSKVTSMQSMFSVATAFNQAVPFDTSKVTIMSTMFAGATSFNQPVLFTIPLLTNATNMFLNATSFNTTNMDNVLIHFASQTTQNNVPMNNNRPRTSASNTAVSTLQSRGWNIT